MSTGTIPAAPADRPVTVSRLWAGDRGRPAFLATGAPALSWSVSAPGEPWEQARAAVEVRRGDAVESWTVEGTTSQHVPWAVAPLGAYDAAEVRVRVEGVDGSRSPFSGWAPLRTGPLGPEDWRAAFVAPGAAAVGAVPERGVARFRTEARVPADVVSAVLSVTAHGAVEAVVGGAPVGDEVLAPGWTAYDARLVFSTHDVTDAVRSATHGGGPLVVGATVAEGWYGERFGFDGAFAQAYEGPVALSLQLRLQDASGAVTWLVTRTHWTTTTEGPVRSASIYGGETVDARHADDALVRPGAELPDARPAVALEGLLATRAHADLVTRLVPASAPPVRVTGTVPVAEVLTTPSGATVLDFGQNLVGRLRLRATGPAGTTVTLRHAEVLEHGELGVRPLRHAAATDRWTLAGDGAGERWAPSFTFHGFRYAEVTGWPGALDPADVVAEVLGSDLVRTGHLTVSDPLLQRLHDNVVWGMRGNFLSVPTDCPQRDERLGWTGDIQVFAPTAAFLYDTAGFLGHWLRDLRAEAERWGTVPVVVPTPLSQPQNPVAAWGDAATLVPWALWQRHGDLAALAEQYPAMRAWVESVRGLTSAAGTWVGGFQLGDWLDPAAPPHNPSAARTDGDLVASALWARSTAVLAEAARLLGHAEDAADYGRVAERAAQGFRDEFVTPAGRMGSHAQTAYALALAFDLVVDPEGRAGLGQRLADLVRAGGYRIGTGFVGTPLVTGALSATGHTDVAFRMLTETGCPSWLYPVTMGATTIWERWDSMLPDGSINPGEMTSFNHYALGAVADWMHAVVGGIAPAEPGSRTVRVAPVPGGGLTSASASLDTGWGDVRTAWTLADRTFTLTLEVPAGTRAVVALPDGSPEVAVGSGRHAWTVTLPAPQPRPDPGPWSLDSTLAEFMDDDAAREGLLAVLDAHGFGLARTWTGGARWRPDTTLRQSLILVSSETEAAIADAVAALPRRR